MQLRAFAKVNLDLSVAGRRVDGFHEVGTILQAIDWFDEIHMNPADHFTFSTTAGPSDESNLVVQTVRGFERMTGYSISLHIHLIKNVPMGAGLGGGSADAAVTFAGLKRWFQADVPDDAAYGLLRSLGTDVPFFAVGGRAAGVGRGDEIIDLEDRTNYTLLLVVPPVIVATREAYSWLTVGDKPRNIEGFRAQFLSGLEERRPVNDFEAAVFARHPELADIKRKLLDLGARNAMLSGSGSTVFGQFDTLEAAREAEPALSRDFLVRLANPLSRADYLERIFAEA
jgi:4-diphosphocytidyl-2-C-methyl-D-erythritol kinase